VEQAVAEQVKYWISNDVHNAQLKFDGLGAASVQVSISMSGNQAQVVFQSDQAHTRALLGNAMTQLEQMLRGEGLTLTSAWVGSSGQQGQFGANSQPPQPTSALPPAATQALAPVPAPASTIASSDHAVDLFV
jgi:flagellar hook-length control protein FliK